MTRLISSIPLVIVGLPPIYVSLQNKHMYMEALKAADFNGDLGPLARLFANESLVAIRNIKELGTIKLQDTQSDGVAHTLSIPFASHTTH